tara:strand:- start:199 stop:1902 length:1704 start_codon:yes stop_codon:yes gene_type:complete
VKKLILLPILLLILFSCSPEEETQAPTNTAQTITPEPETVVVQYTLTVTAGEGGTVSTEGGTFDEGTEVNITATPDQGYEFVGWEQSNSNSNSLTITINSDISMLAIFLEAQNNNYWPLSTIQTLQNNYDGVKNKNSYWFEESEMNYLASENFIVWWDKDYDYLSRANSVLEMYEGIMQLTIDNGWGIPYSKIIPGLDSSNHLMSLYIYTYNDSSDIIWRSNRARCCGVGGNELEGMPYTGMSANFFSELEDGSYQLNSGLKMTLYHEAFHMMQFSMPLNTEGGETFPYRGDSSWWTESTARWFERKYGILEWDGDWATKYNSLCTQYMQPQVSLWTHNNAKPGLTSDQAWGYGMNGYEKGELFRFLIQENYVTPSYVWDMAISKTSLLPQEYLYYTIDDFELVYGQYASKFTSGIMYNESEFSASKSSMDYWLNNSCRNGINCNPETNEAFNNQYVSEIDQSGTNGYVTPVEKNHAWSWTVVRINTSQEQIFAIDFQPDGFGNEGTQSNFNLYLTNRENNLVQEVDFNGEITVNPNLDYFLVMVNTPQRFEGWETFDYQLKVTPNN